VPQMCEIAIQHNLQHYHVVGIGRSRQLSSVMS